MHDNGGLQMAARLKGFAMPWVFVFPAIVIGISILLPFLVQVVGGLILFVIKLFCDIVNCFIDHAEAAMKDDMERKG